MTFQQDLLDEFDRDVRVGFERLVDDYVARVQRDPDTPKDTGKLAAGIVARDIRNRPGSASAEVASTRRSDAGADVGTILDRSTGRLVEASDYGKRAFGPFNGDRGPRTFIPRFRVTTAHVGWWEQVNSAATFRSASDQLGTVDL